MTLMFFGERFSPAVFQQIKEWWKQNYMYHVSDLTLQQVLSHNTEQRQKSKGQNMLK